jgi:threonine/homoserine/homoserine lactone efflux protein
MEVPFLLRSFLVGVLAASGCGPIFVLIFNRSAVCGFLKGFATALGASVGDSVYFLLGLFGALTVISEFSYSIIFIDIIGGVLLLGLGVKSLRKANETMCMTVECSTGYLFLVGKAFMLTLFNPLVLLFFMAVTLQILPENVAQLSRPHLLLGGLCVGLGSLTVLSLVSLAASSLGGCITSRRIRIISGISGIIFIIFGCYLLGDFAKKMFF